MKSESLETMVADMTDGTTEGVVVDLSEEQAIGTVMTVGSTTMPAEVSVSSARSPRVVEETEEVEEVGDDPAPDLHLADVEGPDPLLVVTVVATTMLTIMVTTGSAPSVNSATLLGALSV